MVSKTQNIERWKAKLLAMPRAAKERLLEAAYKNSEAFVAQLEQVIPVEHGELKSTIKNEETDTGYAVSVGGPEAPYPLHLEAGHISRDGKTHVPPKPFYYTSRRVLKKTFRANNIRAVNQAQKDASAGGGS